jgi:hypothetical protein
LVSFLFFLGGCLSAPVPEDLTGMGKPSAPTPLLMKEIVRLSDAGIPDDVIIDLIHARGIVARPSESGTALLVERGVSPPVLAKLLATRPAEPQKRILSSVVYRDFFIPYWPSFSQGHWRLGLRIACFYRDPAAGNIQEFLEEEPKFVDPVPRTISP